MCFGMVIVMTFYNLFINGLIGKVPLNGILIQLMLTFIIAFLLELFIVGPSAQKIAFSLPYDKSKELYVILSISFFMVVGMVLIMSLYGLGIAYFFNTLGDESLLKSYYSLAFKNFIFAFPLQLIIMGPIVRYLFAKFVKGQRMMESGNRI
jgi:sterol desaturase/sphingolipid hydroxylase (fatty acid hydroxylase superfamily)